MNSAFHAYDIRGVWGVDFDASVVYRIGRCLPGLLGASRVLVGRDVRTSSPALFDALARGLAEAGADVDDMGLCTTPMTYFFTGERGYEAAVMITASHNPTEYNGLKISRKGALPVGEDSGLPALGRRIEAELPPPAAEPGAVRRLDLLDDYLAWHRRRLPDLAGLKLVVDCSNGMAGLLARRLFGEGEGTVYLNETPDGTFPNHPPNPLLPEATAQLSAEVVRRGADLGVIFDGDADRVAFVDGAGAFVRPDVVTALLAERFLADEPGAAVLCDIRTSRGVTERIAALGGEPHLWKVGHAFAKVKLRELRAPCGGELAGHYYFRDFHWCDSAVLCAEIVLGLAAAAKRGGRSFADLVRGIDVYANSGECNYTVPDKDGALAAVRAWAETLPPPERVLDFDGVRYDWPDWWFNVRKSNTEPYLRLIAEAKTPALLAERKAAVEAAIRPFLARA
ncbi:MAG: phosphomannomutase/phosphoglucomutase [Kiritimatiellae bacterium]|nr:phosphomannomutase/phosphoglucomutase [Kiritimatiellia bacterium]